MFQTPGQMVFANSGVFADIKLQLAKDAGAQSVLGNLENQIASALNRGVAVIDAAFAGETSKVWGTQTQWYPAGTTQNLFSLFMHCAVSGTEQIFLLPKDPVSNARNQPMAAAYGFAFDENAGPCASGTGGATTGAIEVRSECAGRGDDSDHTGTLAQINFSARVPTDGFSRAASESSN